MGRRLGSKDKRWASDAERFWAKVEVRGPDECWPWTRSVNPKGYGQFIVYEPQRVCRLAHRLAWELTWGPIPEGLKVLHRCDNPPCCNPYKCLFLGTNADNAMDMAGKGRSFWTQKTHCPQGHPYDANNTIVYRGKRYCRTCQAAYKQRWREAQ